MSYTFGPILSRRFGRSLGIDLSPQKKSCNFDCLYCELGGAKPTGSIENPPDPEAVAQEVKEQLARHGDVDVLTITANGEPTLYPHLGTLIDLLQPIKGSAKLLILSNASTITDPAIRKSLSKLDIVKLSLDTATQRTFRRIDRPLRGIEVKKIIEGMERFRDKYDGTLIIEILVVRGINDKEAEFAALGEALRRIRPDRVDLGTIDRPPAYDVKPVDYGRLYELSRHLEGLPVSILTRHATKTRATELSENELLELLRRRPLTHSDIETLFGPKTHAMLRKLLSDGTVTTKEVAGVRFFTA
jgi:wyosine [tRNA(Phe)-imidazoG37] synthetase (radical SAM superfamily)